MATKINEAENKTGHLKFDNNHLRECYLGYTNVLFNQGEYKCILMEFHPDDGDAWMMSQVCWIVLQTADVGAEGSTIQTHQWQIFIEKRYKNRSQESFIKKHI